MSCLSMFGRREKVIRREANVVKADSLGDMLLLLARVDVAAAFATVVFIRLRLRRGRLSTFLRQHQ